MDKQQQIAPPNIAPPTLAMISVADPPKDKLQQFSLLRVNILALQDVLDHLQAGQMKIAQSADSLTYLRAVIQGYVEELPQGESEEQLRVHWAIIRDCPLLKAPNDVGSDLAQYLTLVSEHLRQCLFIIATQTIPSRLEQWLQEARPGYFIPFTQIFEDELPNAEDRAKLLDLLAHEPNAIIGGLVDLDSSGVYRYSTSRRQQTMSCLLAIGSFIVAGGIVIGSCHLPWVGLVLTPANSGRLLIMWIAALIGVLVHIVVDTTKRAQARGEQTMSIAIGDLPLWVNARIGQLMLKLLLTLIGVFGVALSVSPNAGDTVLQPFYGLLIGYSLDSVVGLFGSNLDQRSSAFVSTLTTRVHA